MKNQLYGLLRHSSDPDRPSNFEIKTFEGLKLQRCRRAGSVPKGPQTLQCQATQETNVMVLCCFTACPHSTYRELGGLRNGSGAPWHVNLARRRNQSAPTFVHALDAPDPRSIVAIRLQVTDKTTRRMQLSRLQVKAKAMRLQIRPLHV
jgi:hypothetical protein